VAKAGGNRVQVSAATATVGGSQGQSGPSQDPEFNPTQTVRPF
jgi:hypothetical protein